MASEIRVNKIENRSGLGTVTFADTGVDLAGIVTGTTFSGSGASLTDLPAAQLSGALPAISAASLTNVPAANVVGVHTSLTVTNTTTTGSAVVGGGVTISESGIEASGIGITCANINGTQIGGRRNIIINGAMQVAQRGTSSTTQGFQTLDRFAVWFYGTDEAPTQEQYAMNSNDTGPWEEGFRKAIKITNGNQTSGAEAVDYLYIRTKIEAQDIANSGWDYLNPNSFITLSFWVKANAQTYNVRLQSSDGTNYNYPFQYTVSSASAWQKVIHSIPGNANLQFDNDNGNGLELHWQMYRGSDYTNNSVSNDTWAAYASGTRTKPATSTWWETNDAVFRLTGVQLEVGSQATPFEHRSVGEELALCQRYFTRIPSANASSGYYFLAQGAAHDTNAFLCNFHFPTTMRSNPSLSTTGSLRAYNGGGLTISSIVLNTSSVAGACLQVATSSGLSAKDAVTLGQNNDSDAGVEFSSEL